MLKHPADPLEAGRQRRRHAQPGDQGQRRGDEDGDEVGDQLQAVVGHPAVLGRPVQRQVLDQHRQGVGEHVPAGRHQPLPPAGREQQDVEDHAVEQPQRVDARCHQRARPIEWRSPGSPTWPGRLIESCLAVHSGSAGHRLSGSGTSPGPGCSAGSSTAVDDRTGSARRSG